MQFITFISAATAMVATASAASERTAVTLNKECNEAKPHAKVVNRCEYDVYLWSVLKGTGCPSDGMVTLKTGESYSENYDEGSDATGVSIKISKTEQCAGNDIVQLEYYLEEGTYAGNYLDVSYVDCLGGDCPTKSEGYYLQAGNQTGVATASADNTRCPVLSCHDAASCAKMSYINPDDVATKSCDRDSSMTFYMCGGEAPDGSDSSAPEPASSSEQAQSSAPASSEQAEYSAPSPTSVEDTYSDSNYKVNAAAVTNAPEIKNVEQQKTRTQVEVVYATVTEYVNAKRHAHGHARRHQPFRA